MTVPNHLVSSAAIDFACSELKRRGLPASRVTHMDGWHVQAIVDGEQVNIEVRATTQAVVSSEFKGRAHFVFQAHGGHSDRKRRLLAANRDIVAFVFMPSDGPPSVGWRPHSQSTARIVRFLQDPQPKTRNRTPRKALHEHTLLDALAKLSDELASAA